MLFDLVIAGGQVVLEDRVAEVEVAVAGETIAAIVDRGTPLEARERVDASGMIVVPGAIDGHLHTADVQRFLVAGVTAKRCDTIAECTVSAAYGGITTIIPYVWAQREPNLTDVFEKYIEKGNNKGVTDFAIHSGLLPDEELIRKQIPAMYRLGITSFKMQGAYWKAGLLIPDNLQYVAMRLIAENGGIACVHCENGVAIDAIEADLMARGRVSAEWALPSRPNSLEEEAVGRAVAIAQIADCPLFIVHLTSREGVEAARRAREQGLEVFTEVCPQYLAFTNTDLLATGEFHLARVAPPIREAGDREALWLGLIDGTIDVVASDHAPYPKNSKALNKANIFQIPLGLPTMEPMVPFIFSEGVLKGRLSLLQFAKVMSENPARCFGLYPKKGVVKVGSDADLVLIDPKIEWKIKAENQHTTCDYTLFEDWPVTGKPVRSFLRGHPLLKDDKLHVQPGFGKFVRRPV